MIHLSILIDEPANTGLPPFPSTIRFPLYIQEVSALFTLLHKHEQRFHLVWKILNRVLACLH